MTFWSNDRKIILMDRFSESRRARAMPLITGSQRAFFRNGGVRFMMNAGTTEVPCLVSKRTLSNLGKAAGLTEAPLIFAAYRERIERAASDKWDRSTRQDYEV